MKQKRTLAFLLALVMVLSFCAFGAGKAAADDDVITFENVIVADDENVTIELINFYEKNVNWWEGAQNEKYVTFRFKNKTDHVIKLNPGNFYLNDEKAYVTMEGGTVSLEAGRAGKYAYMVAEDTQPVHTALQSMEELRNLEGSFSGWQEDGKSSRLDVSFSILQALREEASAVAGPDLEKYGEVVGSLAQNVWYFNGGGDTVLNSIAFSDSAATISQVSFDGNGRHEGAVNHFAYTLDDTAITVTLADGSPLVIPYTYADGTAALEHGTYFTPEEIAEGLQGFWTLDSNTKFGHNIFYAHINGNTITSESAAAALNGAPGDYYWYGGSGYSASYQLNFGGFDTEMRHGSNWFFNVIDGKPMLLHYGDVCTPANITKLPGENGYSFK